MKKIHVTTLLLAIELIIAFALKWPIVMKGIIIATAIAILVQIIVKIFK